jgi:hypothetical protein
MRFCELLEAGPVGATFYHVTTDNRLKSIMRTGLDSTGRHRRWHNELGGILGERGFVYLISDFTQAVRFAAKFAYHLTIAKKKMKPVILVLQNIPTDKLVRDDHIEGQLAGHSWYKLPANIPPEDIVRVIPLTPELTKQAIQGSTAAEPEAESEPEPEADASLRIASPRMASPP